MIELSVITGTPEWHAQRATHDCASEAAAAIGMSKHCSRSELMRIKHTGITPDVSEWTQRFLFDKGHEVEALARPVVEARIKQELFPIVCVSDDHKMLASLDGIVILDDMVTIGDLIWENKMLNEGLRDYITANNDLPGTHWPQCEHQLLVTGAKHVYFTTSDGTEEGTTGIFYESNPERRKLLIAGWAQFNEDLKNYELHEAKPALVAEVVKDLPAVMVQVSGSVSIVDNFALFETALRDFVENKLVRSPQTDQDFVDLDAQIKSLKKAEDALDAAEVQMIAQVASVDAMKRTKDMLHKLARDNRLVAEKLLKAEKENRKVEIVGKAQGELTAHLQALHKRCGAFFSFQPAMADAIKGLKSLDSMRDKVSVALANAKIEANAIADRIEANKRQLVETDALGLFPDFAAVCAKAPEDFDALLSMRVTQRKEADAKRLEAEREKIRAEEQAKAEADQRRIAAAERAEQERIEAQAAAAAKAEADRLAAEEIRRIDADRKAQPVVEMFEAMGVKVIDATPSIDEAKGGIPLAEQEQPVTGHIEQPLVLVASDTHTPSNDCLPKIKLGEICARLGFTVSAEFLATIGFEPVATDKNAKLYNEASFPGICRRISDHTLRVGMTKKAA